MQGPRLWVHAAAAACVFVWVGVWGMMGYLVGVMGHMSDGRIWACPPLRRIGEVSSLGGQRAPNAAIFRRPSSPYVFFSEGHACVRTGVWNEGGLTDGGGHVVSGQYHHGPASPNIIWVLNCIFCFWVRHGAGERRRGKRQMVFV